MTTHRLVLTPVAARTGRSARAALITLAATGLALGSAAARAGGQAVDSPAPAPSPAAAGGPTAPDSAPPRVSPRVPSAIVGHGLSFRPVVGALIQTGAQRDLLTDAVAVGGQLGWQFHPNVAVVGNFGWSPSKDRTTAFATTSLGGSSTGIYSGRQERVDVFQYDVGVEARAPQALGASWTVAPYVGLGGGGRSYHYRDLAGAGTQTNVVGYGALGVDLAPNASPVGVRLEARDYLQSFKGLRGELPERKARNDVQLSAGLSYRF